MISIKILNNTIALEQNCWGCGAYTNQDTETCEICKGEGTIPTENGQAILELVKKYGNRKEND